MSNVTGIRRKRTPGAHSRKDFSEIEHDLNQIKCTLACAAAALGKAQDDVDAELAAQSWAVIDSCVYDLGRVEHDLDCWHVAHEHSPREVTHHG